MDAAAGDSTTSTYSTVTSKQTRTRVSPVKWPTEFTTLAPLTGEVFAIESSDAQLLSVARKARAIKNAVSTNLSVVARPT
ncbi:unnamed protein product, partial [Iphiclides podalirius]